LNPRPQPDFFKVSYTFYLTGNSNRKVLLNCSNPTRSTILLALRLRLMLHGYRAKILQVNTSNLFKVLMGQENKEKCLDSRME